MYYYALFAILGIGGSVASDDFSWPPAQQPSAVIAPHKAFMEEESVAFGIGAMHFAAMLGSPQADMFLASAYDGDKTKLCVHSANVSAFYYRYAAQEAHRVFHAKNQQPLYEFPRLNEDTVDRIHVGK